MQKIKNHHLYDWLLAAMLIFLFACMWAINFSGYLSFYNFDMYSDILYAMEVWEHGSVFPDGWVFGNQLYVAATPVLAALLYGMTSDPVTSMALASAILGALVIVSFYWMIAPCFPQTAPRLFACVVMILLPLWFGGAVYEHSGWQLLYTMCSYYACYAITVFWAFGLYIRSCGRERFENWFSLLCLCVFAFCMGMQSLRQTAIMSLPLVAMAFLGLMRNAVRKRKLFGPEFLVAALVALANLAGVVYSRMLSVDMLPIYGEFGITGFSFGSLADAFQTFRQIFRTLKGLLAVGAVSFCGLALAVYHGRKSSDPCGIVLFCLLLFSVGVIGGIDVFSKMEVRSIYYFMAYPLVSFLAAYLLTFPWEQRILRGLCVGVLLAAVAGSWFCRVGPALDGVNRQEERGYEAAADYLVEAGYETVFAGTDLGDKFGLASDLKLRVGFWFTADPFCEVRYLCDPGVFDADSAQCVYAFQGMDRVSDARKKLMEYGLEMELLAVFPDADLYLFTSADPLVILID